MRWMGRRGDRVRITNGKYAGPSGMVESNVYQRTVDWPDERNNGHHIMLDTGMRGTVRREQVERINRVVKAGFSTDLSAPRSRYPLTPVFKISSWAFSGRPP